MAKKVALGALLVALIGILVAGGILGTSTGKVAEAQGRGQGRSQGRGAGQEAGYAAQESAQSSNAATQGNGRGGYGQGAGAAERQYPNYEGAPEDRVLYEGTVIQAPAAGVDLIIKTGSGQEVVVGTGPGYLEDQSLVLQPGEPVQLQGYWEDGEFKAVQVTRLQDGQTVILRDELGRPVWAGGGQRATEERSAIASGEQGQGRGRGQGGSGRGQGGYSGEGSGVLPGSGGDLSSKEVDALLMALADEYYAWSVYDQVIADFGAVRPFTNIQKAEENHIAALETLFDAYGLDVPQNELPGDVPTFDSLTEACEAGVQAEIDNAGLYDQLFTMVDNPDIVQVFTDLQRASQDQHLPAFERCAP